MAHPTADSKGPSDRRSHVLSAERASAVGAQYESRSVLVQRLARHLSSSRWLRLHLLLIVIGAGAAAFFSSVLMLWSGAAVLERMTMRYPLAALCGYVAFLFLISVWVAAQRPGEWLDLDIGEELIDAAVRRRTASPTPEVNVPLELESGAQAPSHVVSRSAGRVVDAGSGWDLDLGDLGGLVVLAACAGAALVGIGYVIYIAPVLLAEVALDAAVVSVVYRRLRNDEAGHWLTAAVGRTWLAALVVVMMALIGGFALEQVAPGAQSVGGVIRALRS